MEQDYLKDGVGGAEYGSTHLGFQHLESRGRRMESEVSLTYTVISSLREKKYK